MKSYITIIALATLAACNTNTNESTSTAADSTLVDTTAAVSIDTTATVVDTVTVATPTK